MLDPLNHPFKTHYLNVPELIVRYVANFHYVKTTYTISIWKKNISYSCQVVSKNVSILKEPVSMPFTIPDQTYCVQQLFTSFLWKSFDPWVRSFCESDLVGSQYELLHNEPPEETIEKKMMFFRIVICVIMYWFWRKLYSDQLFRQMPSIFKSFFLFRFLSLHGLNWA